jgi:hypothetical protein
MDPLYHLIDMQLSRATAASPELARRRKALREHDRAAGGRRARRRRERLWRAAILTARRWGYARGLAGL